MPRMRRPAPRRRAGAVVAVLAIVLLAAACGSASSSSTTTTPTTTSTTDSSTTTTTSPVVVPAGWKSYTYGRATVSVPADWTVATSTGCPPGPAQGLLVLGAPDHLANCPVGVDSVVVGSISAGQIKAAATCPAIMLDGQRATVLPCHAGDGTNIVQYLVPGLGIVAVGNGSPGENVSGTGTNTVVGQVLHTLR